MFEVTSSTDNKDVIQDVWYSKQYYKELWGGFTGDMPSPAIEEHDGRLVFRADLAMGGFKAFAAEKLIAETKEDTIVYCAPRVGHAPDAIASLAKLYGKRCVFFCPSSKEPSNHQKSLLAYDNVELRFVRIAAMPVLNKYAKEWAGKNGAKFFKFGLSGMPLVTAGIVNTADTITRLLGDQPSEIWCAVSTGTMIRGLQIGWDKSLAFGVAVARNMKDGEIGNANVWSAHEPFLKESKVQPPFPTTKTYDAKAWQPFMESSKPGAIFINVGSDDQIERNLPMVTQTIDSKREWGDLRDLH